MPANLSQNTKDFSSAARQISDFLEFDTGMWIISDIIVFCHPLLDWSYSDSSLNPAHCSRLSRRLPSPNNLQCKLNLSFRRTRESQPDSLARVSQASSTQTGL